MISESDVFHINFYKKEKFNGSCRGMHYRIAAQEEDGERFLLVTEWPGPYNYDTTPEEKKTRKRVSFSDEGLKEAVAWLNGVWEEKYRDSGGKAFR